MIALSAKIYAYIRKGQFYEYLSNGYNPYFVFSMFIFGNINVSKQYIVKCQWVDVIWLWIQALLKDNDSLPLHSNTNKISANAFIWIPHLIWKSGL